MAPETKRWHNYSFFNYLFSPKDGMLTHTTKCTTYQFTEVEWRNHLQAEAAFYWHYFYLFKFLLSQLNYVYSTHSDDRNERPFCSQSYFKTNKLAFRLKGSDHKWRFWKQPLEHPNHILNILYGFIFRLDILCKVFFSLFSAWTSWAPISSWVAENRCT